MAGGLGNDAYFIDSTGDRVIERLGQGVDAVKSLISDVLSAGVENLSLLGAATINGFGNALGNQIAGNRGANALIGRGGDDVLRAGGGDDRLHGGAGSDDLYGGAGRDQFVFRSIGDAGNGRTSDMVGDFQDGADKIDLHWIDADTGRSGNQHFDFIGRAAFSGAAGELRSVGRTLAGDVDGDGMADFRVEVVSDARLDVTDLLV